MQGPSAAILRRIGNKELSSGDGDDDLAILSGLGGNELACVVAIGHVGGVIISAPARLDGIGVGTGLYEQGRNGIGTRLGKLLDETLALLAMRSV